MPARTLLSAEQRTRLFAIPTDSVGITRHYTLDADDLALIRTKRRTINRLGFAVQLRLLRYPGLGMGPLALPPETMCRATIKMRVLILLSRGTDPTGSR